MYALVNPNKIRQWGGPYFMQQKTMFEQWVHCVESVAQQLDVLALFAYGRMEGVRIAILKNDGTFWLNYQDRTHPIFTDLVFAYRAIGDLVPCNRQGTLENYIATDTSH